MEDKKRDSHCITLEDRESISITGVNEVLSFDEETVAAETTMGMITVKGEALHVTGLDLEKGLLNVEGEITGFEYSESGFGKKGSFLSHIFK